MKPSREEIEKDLGFSLPDNISLEVGDSPPQDDESSGVKFELVGFIIGKFQAFRKTKFGKLIEVYIYITGIGFSLPTPLELSKAIVADISQYSYAISEQIEYGFQTNPEHYIVNLPKGLTGIINEDQKTPDNFPIGTGIYPISVSYLEA